MKRIRIQRPKGRRERPWLGFIPSTREVPASFGPKPRAGQVNGE